MDKKGFASVSMCYVLLEREADKCAYSLNKSQAHLEPRKPDNCLSLEQGVPPITVQSSPSLSAEERRARSVWQRLTVVIPDNGESAQSSGQRIALAVVGVAYTNIELRQVTRQAVRPLRGIRAARSPAADARSGPAARLSKNASAVGGNLRFFAQLRPSLNHRAQTRRSATATALPFVHTYCPRTFKKMLSFVVSCDCP